jgi:hypothetical protein
MRRVNSWMSRGRLRLLQHAYAALLDAHQGKGALGQMGPYGDSVCPERRTLAGPRQ